MSEGKSARAFEPFFFSIIELADELLIYFSSLASICLSFVSASIKIEIEAKTSASIEASKCIEFQEHFPFLNHSAELLIDSLHSRLT